MTTKISNQQAGKELTNESMDDVHALPARKTKAAPTVNVSNVLVHAKS